MTDRSQWNNTSPYLQQLYPNHITCYKASDIYLDPIWWHNLQAILIALARCIWYNCCYWDVYGVNLQTLVQRVCFEGLCTSWLHFCVVWYYNLLHNVVETHTITSKYRPSPNMCRFYNTLLAAGCLIAPSSKYVCVWVVWHLTWLHNENVSSLSGLAISPYMDEQLVVAWKS